MLNLHWNKKGDNEVNGKCWAALAIAAALLIFSIVTNAFCGSLTSKDFQTTLDGIMNPTDNTVWKQ